MKAVSLTFKNGGDDLFQNRLFSYLQKQLIVPIEEIVPIKNKVYRIKADTFNFILKGFFSYHQFVLQDSFSDSLHQEGFNQTYTFYPLAKEPPLLFDQTYYGCLEYIHPSTNTFTFQKQEDRLKGLEILSHFHAVTEKLTGQFQMAVPHFNQIEKWQERTAIFLNNLPVIRYFIQKEMVNEWLLWADWSLKGMQKESYIFENGKKVILHGDVAHHNFLRAKNGDVYLIDFDLISLGNSRSDYLQYANRILPFINWSLEDLADYKELADFLDEEGFIYALAFPTDIFREWNRAIREKTYLKPTKIQALLDLTVKQFQERQNFFMELKKRVGQ